MNKISSFLPISLFTFFFIYLFFNSYNVSLTEFDPFGIQETLFNINALSLIYDIIKYINIGIYLL